MAENLRVAGGDITRRRLIEALATAPRLKAAPRFADTWRRLIAESERELARQPRSIGAAALHWKERTQSGDLLMRAQNAAGRCCCLRTVRLRKVSRGQPIVHRSSQTGASFVVAATVGAGSPNKSATGLLCHGDSIVDVLANVSSSEAWLFVDGIDRATREDQFRHLAAILTAGRSRNAMPWRIVVTCQEEHWVRVRRLLLNAGVRVDGWRSTEIEPLTRGELAHVTRKVPAILPVVNQPQLRTLMCRPLILDLLV